jgi:hypothetical protein
VADEKKEERTYPDGTLTRQEMEKVLRENGSVMHQGRVIDKVEDLPAEADLARAHPAAARAAAARIDADIARLAAERAKLLAPPEQGAQPAKAAAPEQGELERLRRENEQYKAQQHEAEQLRQKVRQLEEAQSQPRQQPRGK